MATEVSICNQAISWLGGTLITSLNDNSAEAKLCKANYEPLRDLVLESKDWTFATTRAKLAKLGTPPVYGYSAAFAVPSDTIRILQCSPNPSSGASSPGPSRGDLGFGDELRTSWQREGETIVCDEDTLYCRYIQKITDPSKFSPGFAHSLAARIAWDIANPLTRSNKLEEQMKDKYEASIDDSGTMDGLQGRSHKIRSDALTRIR